MSLVRHSRQVRSHPSFRILTTRKVLARLNYAWDNSALPFYVCVRNLTEWCRAYSPSQGVTYVVGEELVIAYAGISDGRVHILPFLEQRVMSGGQDIKSQFTRQIAHANIDQTSALPSSIILALGCFEFETKGVSMSRSLVLPFRLQLTVPIDVGSHSQTGRLSTKSRQQFQREQRRRNWSMEIGTSDGDFAYFLDSMHIPTMRIRHGSATRSLSRDVARDVFEHGYLFFLLENGRRVSGLLARFDATSMRLTIRMSGVDDVGSAYSKGASIAIYMFVLEWCREQGIREVDLSGCEPFLSKGIFQFKRKMHPTVILPRNHFYKKRLLLHIPYDTPSVRDFLVANPVISISKFKKLTATYFWDNERPPRRDLAWQTPGLSESKEIHLDEFFGPCDAGNQPILLRRLIRNTTPRLFSDELGRSMCVGL